MLNGGGLFLFSLFMLFSMPTMKLILLKFCLSFDALDCYFVNHNIAGYFRYVIMRQCWYDDPNDRPSFTDLRVQLEMLLTRDRNYLELDNINVPLSTPETSSGSPESDETASLLAAQALQTTRKSSKDELTVNVCIHEKSVDRLLKRKGDIGSHNITIL